MCSNQTGEKNESILRVKGFNIFFSILACFNLKCFELQLVFAKSCVFFVVFFSPKPSDTDMLINSLSYLQIGWPFVAGYSCMVQKNLTTITKEVNKLSNLKLMC